MGLSLEELVSELYTPVQGAWFLRKVEKIGTRYARHAPSAPRGKRSQRARASGGSSAGAFDDLDSVIITYGNQFHGNRPEGAAGGGGGRPTLHYLQKFLDEHARSAVGGVHILPFCPSSSDEGFSVIDYRQVDKNMGSWRHIRDISRTYTLMVDLVLNHCSAQSRWARLYKKNKRPYNDFFIPVDPDADLSGIFRPRTLPLHHPLETVNGTQQVWTTFSADQLDLNYRNPELFAQMIDILFLYILQGATIIRLDAVAFLWKEIGTPSIHHPLTHVAVQIFRALIDRYAPHVYIVTETNVPHTDNISYFGDGTNEAHMVYNFTLPPLTLDAFVRGDARHLTEWAATLKPPAAGRTAFFNFLASHDGIGVLAAADYLTSDEMKQLLHVTKQRGGEIGYKQTAAGPIPYELNINYLSAITAPDATPQKQAESFLCSQAIMLSMAGVAAPYIHSILGSQNWRDGIDRGMERRSINRQRLDYEAVAAQLQHAGNLRYLIIGDYLRMLALRRSHPALHPTAQQKILNLHRQVFGLIRQAPGGEVLYCLHNVSNKSINKLAITPPPDNKASWKNLLTGQTVSDIRALTLKPYQYVWVGRAGDVR